MKVIERKLHDCFWHSKPVRISNSEVTVFEDRVTLRLFGNCIAIRDRKTARVVWTLAGWNTVTTRSRLNHVVGVGVFNSKRRPHVERNTEVQSNRWYTLSGHAEVSNLEQYLSAPERAPLNSYDAVMACEQAAEVPDGYSIEECWQFLVDTGLAWSLQGYFGRTAQAMIEAGIIRPKQ